MQDPFYMEEVPRSERVGNRILIYAIIPTIPELIDIINGLGLTSSNASIHPLEHICTDLDMYLSKVDLYEKTGKLAFEKAQELRQAGTALKDELAC
jgi:hypothetical protein